MRNRKQTKVLKLTLDEQLSAIGMMISSRSLTSKEIECVDIEEALASAFVSLNHSEDLRLLSLLLSWVSIHGSSVVIEKLMKILLRKQTAGEVVQFAALIARFAERAGFKRWKTLIAFTPQNLVIVGPSKLAQSLVDLRGEEKWSENCGFFVPKGSAPVDSKWVLARESLAGINRQYRNRLIYGGQWRADIITAIELGAKTPTEASRISGASYEPCHRVMSELKDAGMLTSKDRPLRKAI
jgi:hypothetical protein